MATWSLARMFDFDYFLCFGCLAKKAKGDNFASRCKEAFSPADDVVTVIYRDNIAVSSYDTVVGPGVRMPTGREEWREKFFNNTVSTTSDFLQQIPRPRQ
jgi:hypothetical protein